MEGAAIWQEMETQSLPETLLKAETVGEKYPSFTPLSLKSSANTSHPPNLNRKDHGVYSSLQHSMGQRRMGNESGNKVTSAQHNEINKRMDAKSEFVI